MQLRPYLAFSGNCREAMEFYHKCLGGHLYLQTVEDSSGSTEGMPAKMKQSILQANLIKDDLILLATDLVAEQGIRQGSSVSLCLVCNSPNQLRKVYNMLSEGGMQTQPPSNTFEGTISGNLIDRFGNWWYLQSGSK